MSSRCCCPLTRTFFALTVPSAGMVATALLAGAVSIGARLCGYSLHVRLSQSGGCRVREPRAHRSSPTYHAATACPLRLSACERDSSAGTGRLHRRLARERRDRDGLAWLIEHRAQILASLPSPRSRSAVCCMLRVGCCRAMPYGRAAVALLAAELAFEVGRTIVVEHSLGVDTIALVAMVGALALGRGARRGGDRADVLRRRGAGVGRFPARAAGADRADPARTEGRAAARRRSARGGAGRPGADRRRRGGADRRGRAGRRNDPRAPRR